MQLCRSVSFVKEVDSFLYTKASFLSGRKFSSSSSSRSKVKVENVNMVTNVDETVYACGTFNATDSTLLQEIEILGSQSLADFAAGIYCPTKEHTSSNNDSESSKDFLFINGTFFVDNSVLSTSNDGGTACTNNVVSDIQIWLKKAFHSMSNSVHRLAKKKRNVADDSERNNDMEGSLMDQTFSEWLSSIGIADVDDIPIKSLQATKFRELQDIKFTTRYLFCHRGCCEHPFIIIGQRQFHPALDSDPLTYPRITYQKKHKRKRCSVCDANSAKFVTYGDRLAESNPCYFCE